MPTAAIRPARPCGYPSHLRARGHRLCARPRGSRCRTGCRRQCSGPIHRKSNGDDWFLLFRRDNSSSSSHLCKLWRTAVCAGQTGYPPVVWLWRTRGKTRVAIHSRPPPPGCPRLSTGCPPLIHRVSPQCCGRRGSARVTSSPEPSTGRPQAHRPPWTTGPSSPGVHSTVPRVCPQSVGNRLGTERGFPPPVTQGVWTTGRCCGRTRHRWWALNRVEGQAAAVHRADSGWRGRRRAGAGPVDGAQVCGRRHRDVQR